MGKFIKIVMGLSMAGIGLYVMSELLKTIDTTQLPSSVKPLLDIMPLVYAAGVIISIVTLTLGGTAVVRYLKWRAFGNRLKEGYTAKFGYPNPQFNEAIDQHIKVMETMHKGTEMNTKQVAENWLKGMAHMVEVPFVIPEEEHLSETEKTEQFDNTITSDECGEVKNKDE